MLRSTGKPSRPQIVQLVPFSSSPHTSARRNRTAYRDVSWRSSYTYTTHALIDENYQEHAHARVCSALTYSILQCPGVMPGFTGDWCKGPLSGVRLQGWKQALVPLWSMDYNIPGHPAALAVRRLATWISAPVAPVAPVAPPRPRNPANPDGPCMPRGPVYSQHTLATFIRA